MLLGIIIKTFPIRFLSPNLERTMANQTGPVCNFLLASTFFFLLTGTPAQAATVLFDQGHGQAFLVEKNDPLDLSKMAGVMKEQGLEVKINKEPLSNKALKGVAALVISGAFKPFAEEELKSIYKFVEDGGKLCLMLHIPHPVQPLLRGLGVAHSQAPLHEQENILEGNAKNFTVTNLTAHPITQGLPSFNAYGAWGVMPEKGEGRMLATTSAKGWIDVNNNQVLDQSDGVYAYGVVVAGTRGKGAFAVFGDDAIFQNQFLVHNNLLLARNLADWLRGSK